MRFLNQKEEVYDIQLTQYGKRLVAQGQFQPEYYAFFDEEIYYDDQYCGVSSSQSSSIDRIQELPQFGAGYIQNGVETTFQKSKKGTVLEDTSLKASPIGTASPGSLYKPAFSVKFLYGELSSSIEYLSGSFNPTTPIPQLSSSIEYGIRIRQTDQASSEQLMTKQDIEQKVYEDGSYVFLDKDFLFLEMVEQNCPVGAENFEMEIFEVKESADGSEEFSPMKLGAPLFRGSDVADDRSEYYVDVMVDNEIEDRLYCEYEKKIKTQSVFVSEEQSCRVKEKQKFVYRQTKDVHEDDC